MSEYVPKARITAMIREFRKPLNKSLREAWLAVYWTYRLIKWQLFGHDQVVENDRARRATKAEKEAEHE
jgi:hypothetical protein